MLCGLIVREFILASPPVELQCKDKPLWTRPPGGILVIQKEGVLLWPN